MWVLLFFPISQDSGFPAGSLVFATLEVDSHGFTACVEMCERSVVSAFAACQLESCWVQSQTPCSTDDNNDFQVSRPTPHTLRGKIGSHKSVADARKARSISSLGTWPDPQVGKSSLGFKVSAPSGYHRAIGFPGHCYHTARVPSTQCDLPCRH